MVLRRWLGWSRNCRVVTIPRALASVALLAVLATGCADDPFAIEGPRSCEVADQNAWVYELMQTVYLWQDELPEVDPGAYDSPEALLRDLRADDDRWSRIADQKKTQALFEEGKVIGLGFGTRRDDTGALRVATVHEHAPAGQAGLRRGDELIAIAGIPLAQIEAEDLWDRVYGENAPGVRVQVTVLRDGEELEFELEKDWFSLVTVPTWTLVPQDDRSVGYVLFSSFVDTSYAELDEAFSTFAKAGVRHVVVDLRYNGGGRVAVARHLINLLVGSVADGKTAYRVRYAAPLSEHDSERSVRRQAASLPHVEHVVFITSGSTLSASELVINAVRPYTKVSLVGQTTGGKPVGSMGWTFCDKVIMPITFELLNAENEGAYFDGFPPDCAAPDDLHHALGDAAEASLHGALSLVAGAPCPSPPIAQSTAADGSRGDRDLPSLIPVPELRGTF